jgi:D-alanyl-D-alanine carboxypeptidase
MTILLIVTLAVVCVAIWGCGKIGKLADDKSGGGMPGGDVAGDTAGDTDDPAARDDNADDTAPGADERSGASEEEPQDTYARFSALYYYEEELLDRYLRYEAAHPELAPEEVVWRVDVDTDKPFYEDVVEITDVHSEQTLVNKHFKFPDDFEPWELVRIDGEYRVTPATKAAYESMRADATAAGMSVRAASAYRSIEYQVNLYARYMNEDPNNADNYSARPAFSEHHTGRTVDLVGPSGTLRGFTGTQEAEWVRENAWNYGFIVRYTPENEDVTGYESEPWHVTYIGKDAAALMREEGIGSLEEYVAKYVRHTPPAQQ